MSTNYGRMGLWPVAVIAFIVVLAAASITPTVKLNTAPPSDFVTLRASAKGPDTDMARGYWEAAVRVIQWKYTRTSSLPLFEPEFCESSVSVRASTWLTAAEWL